jgi:hypothetical protein
MWLMSVDLIVNALVTGAAAGASASASSAVTDAYTGVKRGVRRLFHRAADSSAMAGDPDTLVDELLAAVEADPKASREVVAEQLTGLWSTGGEAGDGEDAELLAAARRVVELTGGDVRVGKYHVELRDNTGVQVGDHNSMTLNLDSQGQGRP